MKNRELFLTVIIGLLVAGGIYMVETRGFRNNNPGNLRFGVKWLGVIGQDSEGYAIFDHLENGIRAMGVDLLTKMARGVNTIASIISVYAPSGDNNPTNTYIASVAEWTGLDPNQTLTRDDLANVVNAMIRFENGHTAPTSTLNEGINRALTA